jgi:hypothetical protein
MLGRFRDPWFVQKAAVVLLMVGLGLLLVEVRFEHQVVLAKKWQSWIPLFYAMTMIAVGAASLAFWDMWGRKIMLAGLLMGAMVGLLGFWFHSKGDPAKAISKVVRVISSRPGRIPTDSDGPPPLAPLAVMGLTLLGAVICMPEGARNSKDISRLEER